MKIYVIGTGTMAKGIVKAFAAKMPVVMKSRTQASLDKAMASIEKGYAKLVEKGKMTEEAKAAILANITTTTDYATFADADYVHCPGFAAEIQADGVWGQGSAAFLKRLSHHHYRAGKLVGICSLEFVAFFLLTG